MSIRKLAAAVLSALLVVAVVRRWRD